MECSDELTEPTDYLEVANDLLGVLGDKDYLVLDIFIPVPQHTVKMVEPVCFCVLKVVTHDGQLYIV